MKNFKRNGKEDHRVIHLKIVKTMMWIWVLGAFTMTLFLPAKLFFDPAEPINYYVLAILSGLAGSIWGVVINEVANDWKTVWDIKEISELEKDEYDKHLKKWIAIAIFTIIYIVLLTVVITYFDIG